MKSRETYNAEDIEWQIKLIESTTDGIKKIVQIGKWSEKNVAIDESWKRVALII
jgi:hypothetical protein